MKWMVSMFYVSTYLYWFADSMGLGRIIIVVVNAKGNGNQKGHLSCPCSHSAAYCERPDTRRGTEDMDMDTGTPLLLVQVSGSIQDWADGVHGDGTLQPIHTII